MKGKITREELDQSLVTYLETIDSQLNIVEKQIYYIDIRTVKCDDGEFVKGDGIHDDTTGIQRALDMYNCILFKNGIFKVTEILNISSNKNLLGSEATIIFDKNTLFYGSSMLNSNNIIENKLINIKIDNIKFKAETNGSVVCRFKTIDNLKLLNNNTINCGLIELSSVFNADDIWNKEKDPLMTIFLNDTYLSNNIEILSNTLYGNDSLKIENMVNNNSILNSYVNGIELRYVKNCIVSFNNIKWFVDGIKFWGGDVGNSYNKPDKEYFCKDIRATNNNIECVSMGALWCSRCKNVIFANNTSTISGDVAYDVEGSDVCIIESNYGIDARNGVLTNLFNSTNVIFSNNIAETSNKYNTKNFAIITGLNGYHNSVDTVFNNNIFRSHSHTTNLLSVGSNIRTSCINFNGNKFINCGMRSNTTKTPKFIIKNNHFYFDSDLNTDIIQLTTFDYINTIAVEFIGNRFSSSNGFNSNNFACLSIDGKVWAAAPKFMIKNNTFEYKASSEGYPIAIRIKKSSVDTNGWDCLYVISNNIMETMVNDNTVTMGIVVLENNKTNIGKNYPNNISSIISMTGHKYNNGQVIYYDKPSNEGYTQAMFVDGEWKEYNKIL